MEQRKRSLEDNPWFIAATIIAVFLVVGVPMYFLHQSDLKSTAKYAAMEQERLKQPIVELRNGYIQVDQMGCSTMTESFSKRQLSELDEVSKWMAKYSKTCGITYEKVRIRKDRVRSYYPHYSVYVDRLEKYADDPGGPLYIKETNVENCNVAVGPPDGKAEWMVVSGKCSLLDGAL